MASLYKQKKSRFYWVKYRDPITGTIVRESTKCRVGIGPERRKAEEICAQLTLRETESAPSARKEERWENWVPSFLAGRHANTPRTLARNLTAWKTLYRFLSEHLIPTPRHLTRTHCFAFVEWRQKAGHQNSAGKTAVHLNTVLFELKVLSKICHEAVLRQYAAINPTARLGLKRVEAREKDELTDWHIATIRSEIARLKALAGPDSALHEFLEVSFEIALHQGWRMAETWIAMADVDLEHRRVRVLPKGGKAYWCELSEALVPLFTRLQQAGRSHTYTRPRQPSLKWFKFFDRLRANHPGRFDNISFHSTRVTAASRLERAGAPEKLTMDLMNHASTTVHRIYRRATRGELRGYLNQLAAGVAAPPSRSGENPDAPRSKS